MDRPYRPRRAHRPIDEWIQKARLAQKQGDNEAREVANNRIDAMQRGCPHPPHRLQTVAARAKHSKGLFDVGTPLIICLDCSRLVAVMMAPYRAEMDDDESFERVVQALQIYNRMMDDPEQSTLIAMQPPVDTDELQKTVREMEEDEDDDSMCIVGLHKFLSQVEEVESTPRQMENGLLYLAGYIDALHSKIKALEALTPWTVQEDKEE